MRKRWIWMPAMLAGFVLFIFLGGEVVRLLWNWLLPPLFDWRPITFWQALGLLALTRILFGGFGGRGRFRGHGGFRRHMSHRIADRVAARWERMSPEEREQFRQRIRERCGFDPVSTNATQV
jgi:hypothetical protein